MHACGDVLQAARQDFDEFEDEDWKDEVDLEQESYWLEDWDVDDVRCSRCVASALIFSASFLCADIGVIAPICSDDFSKQLKAELQQHLGAQRES